MRARRFVTSLLATAVLVAWSSPALASAGDDGASVGPGTMQPNLNVQYRDRLIVTSTTNGVRTDKLLLTCSAPVGGSCTFSQTVSVTTTIAVGLGMTRGWVAGNISFSSAASQSFSVQCTVPITRSGQVARLYPRGTTKHYYIVHEVTSGVGNPWIVQSQTGDLEAFQADGIACQ